MPRKSTHEVLPDGRKICTKCKEPKPLEAFVKCSEKASGYRNHCKACMNAYNTKRVKKRLEEEPPLIERPPIPRAQMVKILSIFNPIVNNY